MRAAVIHAYGPPEVVRITDVATPTIGANEVLVRVAASAVTAGDARIRAARFPRGFAPFARLAFGIRAPRQGILGVTFSGTVEQVGSAVTTVKLGDEVTGMNGARMRCHAELVAVRAERLARKPADVTHDNAAAMVFGGTTALHFLRDKAGLQPGASVLVNGASGAVGTNAVQLARHMGAVVTTITSAGNADLARRLGAARVIDYRTTPLSAITERFDVVFDTVGNISPAFGRTLLKPNGTVLLAAADLGETLRARGNVKTGSSGEKAVDVEYLLQLMADSHLEAVIEETVGLDDIASAHRRVDSGRKVGNIVVRPGA